MLLRGDFASIFSKQIQIGPDPNLTLEPADEFPINTHAVYDFLSDPRKDWAVGVEVTTWDVLIGSLWTWMALHESHVCKLTARGDMVEQGIVPPLFGIDGKQKSTGTVILLDETGLAALMRPPDQPAPLTPVDQVFTPAAFSLFVRQFGSDEPIAERFIKQVQAWDRAGRPTFDGMRIRAFPKDAEYVPSEGEFVIEKQWTKLVIEWPCTPRPRTSSGTL